MTEKRFRYDWKTGGFKDTLSNSCATTDIRVFERQINNVCFNYEKKIKKLEKENKELKEKNKFILGQIRAFRDDCYTTIDFDGASTLNRLLDILREER